MTLERFIALFSAILLSHIHYAYSTETPKSFDGVVNLRNYGGKIFAVEWLLSSHANKSAKKKALALLTDTQIVTIDPDGLVPLYTLNHRMKLEEKLMIEKKVVFRYLSPTNELLLCSGQEGSNCTLFPLNQKNELLFSQRPTDLATHAYNGVMILPLEGQTVKNGSARVFLAGKTQRKSFIEQRELPRIGESGVKQDNDGGLSSVNKLENLYAFTRQGFSYFLRNAEIENKSSGETLEVLKLSRLCNGEKSKDLKSWIDISLSCSGDIDFLGGAAVYSGYSTDGKDRLIVGERHQFHQNNIVNDKNRICIFDMSPVAAKFDSVWSTCQTVTSSDREDCDSAPNQDFCDAYAHTTQTFCAAFGGKTETYGISKICYLDDFAGFDYTHIESYKRFDGKRFAKLEDGYGILALAESELSAANVVFAAVNTTSASFIQRIVQHEESTLNRVVWEAQVDKPILTWNKNYWIAGSGSNLDLWPIDVKKGCEWFYRDCPAVLNAVGYDPLRCLWCVSKNGSKGYASSDADCPRTLNRLNEKCLPLLSEKVLSSQNSTVLHIQGKGLSFLADSTAKTSVTTCKNDCLITEISNEKITCTVASGIDNECDATVKFVLEDQEFEFSLPGIPPTSLPNHLGGAANNLTYLAGGIIFLVALIGCVLGAIVWSRRKARKPEDDGGSSILPLSVNGAGYLHPRGRIARNSYDGQPGGSMPLDQVPYEDLQFLVPENIRVELNSLDIANVVGEGHFGIVYKAIYKTPEATDLLVAVKTLHAGIRGVREFLQEGIIMEHFNHLRVMSLIGISFTEANYPMIITPFMPKGDLLSYLRDPSNTPNLRQLLKFAVEIAEGMQYLHKLKFIHRDLAARNCMLDGTLCVKIADFGLCRDVYESGSYEPRHRDRDLPLRWMAPESIERQEYTFKGDVWSYGVVLWELMTRGAVPYHGTPGYLILPALKNGDRLAQPDYCPTQLYEVMCDCWRLIISERPSFSQICLTVPGVVQALETSLAHKKSLEHHYYVNWEAQPVGDVAAV